MPSAFALLALVCVLRFVLRMRQRLREMKGPESTKRMRR